MYINLSMFLSISKKFMYMPVRQAGPMLSYLSCVLGVCLCVYVGIHIIRLLGNPLRIMHLL